MELKYGKKQILLLTMSSSNRTFMELKWNTLFKEDGQKLF